MDAGGGERPIVSRRLADWGEASRFEADWERLLERAGGGVFQTLPWQLAWWEAFGAGRELCLLIALRDGQLVGAAPLAIERGSRRGGCIRFIGSGNHASDYCDLIVDPAHPAAVDALLACACESAGPAGSFELSHLPAQSPNRARIQSFLKRRGYWVRTTVEQLAPARRLGDAEADRRAAGKQSLRRHLRRYLEAGELRYERAADVPDALGRLDEFFAQHVARWGGTPTPSQFLDPAQRDFFRALVARLMPRGWLRFDTVRFDGQPIAFHFGFEHRRRFTWYKPAFDIRQSARSPGEVLIKHLLDDAIARGLEEFDFTIGAEPFKLRFANLLRPILRISAHGSAARYWREGATGLARHAWRRLHRRDTASIAGQAAARGITIAGA